MRAYRAYLGVEHAGEGAAAKTALSCRPGGVGGGGEVAEGGCVISGG